MKNIFNIIVILLTLFLSYTCGVKNKPGSKIKEITKTHENDSNEVDIVFESKELHKIYYNESYKTDDSTFISLNYVFMTKGPNKDKINSFIEKELIQSSYYNEEDSFYNLQDILNSFIRDFKSFGMENPDFPQNWFYEISAKDIYYTPKILCLEISSGGYTGGAHGNYSVSYYNIELNTGELLKLDNLLIKGFEKKLNELIDKKFREAKGLKPGDDLEKDGGLFENKIKYNDNFAVTKEGLKFYYNNYEIAPYAAGPTELLITYTELKDLIPENSLLNFKE